MYMVPEPGSYGPATAFRTNSRGLDNMAIRGREPTA